MTRTAVAKAAPVTARTEPIAVIMAMVRKMRPWSDSPQRKQPPQDRPPTAAPTHHGQRQPAGNRVADEQHGRQDLGADRDHRRHHEQPRPSQRRAEVQRDRTDRVLQKPAEERQRGSDVDHGEVTDAAFAVP
jgi:hypothetical protein